MKHLAVLLLAAAALAATPAAGQTIKSLGYNTTNGNVVYSGTNALTFTNALSFGTNAAATTRTNLNLGASDSVTFAAAFIGTATDQLEIISEEPEILTISYRTNNIAVSGIAFTPSQIIFSGPFVFNTTNQAATTRTNLGLGLPALTNTSNVTMMRALGGSTNTNQPFSGSISVVGTNNTNTLVFSNGILLSQ